VRVGAAHVGSAHVHASHVGGSTSCLVDSHHNGVELLLKLSLPGIEIRGIRLLVALEPYKDLHGLLCDGVLLILGEIYAHSLVIELVLHLEAVVLETVLCLDSSFNGIISTLVLHRIGNHLFNFLL